MYPDYIRTAAAAMAENMAQSEMPLYGEGLRLPDRKAVIALIKEIRRLMFPAYYGDASLMTLAPEEYASLLLDRIEKSLCRQIALALPAEDAHRADAIAREFVECLPNIQAMLLKDLDATFDGDPAAQDKNEIIFAYPGLFAIFVYRIAHELYLRKVPMIPRIMTEYAHSQTGIDIHPGATIGDHFFIDHGTGIVIGQTTVIGKGVKIYQGVTLGGLSTRGGQSLRTTKRHPTIEDNVTIYANASILGGTTIIGHNSVIGANAFITESIPPCTTVTNKSQELQLKTRQCHECHHGTDLV